jgi:hypothetical protein
VPTRGAYGRGERLSLDGARSGNRRH